MSQPLRVESGGANFLLPVDWSYADQAATLGRRSLSLAPHGREVLTELAWRAPLLRGSFATSVFYRRNPGHYAALPDDAGLALRWDRGF